VKRKISTLEIISRRFLARADSGVCTVYFQRDLIPVRQRAALLVLHGSISVMVSDPEAEGAGGVMKEGRGGYVILPDVVVGECSFKQGQRLITPSIKAPLKAWGRQEGAVRVFEGLDACDALLSVLSRERRPMRSNPLLRISEGEEEEANARRLRREADELLNALGDAAGSVQEAVQLAQASRKITFETVRILENFKTWTRP
jgi:hypothetical protein